MSDPVSADELGVVVDRLVGQVAHWTPSRWGAASGVSGPSSVARSSGAAGPLDVVGRPGASSLSRADVMHRLVQLIADLAAGAAGEPPRPVPRLDNDLALPDQLTVVVRDLLRATPDAGTLAAVHSAVVRARTALWG